MKRELLVAIRELLDEKLDEKLEPIKAQQQEDHVLIKALMHAVEVHDAKIENLTLTGARIEGRVTGIEGRVTGIEGRLTAIEGDVKELKTDVAEIKDTQREFYEMYGEHENQIRSLRRKLAGM